MSAAYNDSIAGLEDARRRERDTEAMAAARLIVNDPEGFSDYAKIVAVGYLAAAARVKVLEAALEEIAEHAPSSVDWKYCISTARKALEQP